MVKKSKHFKPQKYPIIMIIHTIIHYLFTLFTLVSVVVAVWTWCVPKTGDPSSRKPWQRVCCCTYLSGKDRCSGIRHSSIHEALYKVKCSEVCVFNFCCIVHCVYLVSFVVLHLWWTMKSYPKPYIPSPITAHLRSDSLRVWILAES